MNIRCFANGNTKKAWLFIGILLAAAALALLLDNLKLTEPLIAQLVLLFSLIAAVYLLIRHVTCAYAYEVMPVSEEEGETSYTLYIIRMQGKKGLTQAMLPLSALTAIAREKPEGLKTAVSNFSPVLLAEDDIYLAFDPKTERTLIRIHADEAFVKALFELVPTAKDHLDPPPAEAKPSAPRGMYDISDIEPPKESKNDTEE